MIIAGIGARVTPPDVLAQISQAALQLAIAGHHGRSGGATGADAAFASGYSVIAPHLFTEYPERIGHYIEWQEHAARHHPAWDKCDEFARRAHGRNSAIMMGDSPIRSPKPVDAVLCWTEGGAIKGGTGQALRIAMGNGIPIFNLAVRPIAQFWEWVAGQ